MRIRIYLKCKYPPFQNTSIDMQTDNENLMLKEILDFKQKEASDFVYTGHTFLRNWR